MDNADHQRACDAGAEQNLRENLQALKWLAVQLRWHAAGADEHALRAILDRRDAAVGKIAADVERLRRRKNHGAPLSGTAETCGGLAKTLAEIATLDDASTQVLMARADGVDSSSFGV